LNRYQNLDIDLLDHRHSDDGEFLRARVAFSPVGEQRDGETEELSFPVRLRERLSRLERRELQFDELILLGEELASLLLPPAIRGFYLRSLEKLREDEGLRIRIRPHDHSLAVLPWEYAYVQRPDVPPGRKGPEGFLALDKKLSLVRYEVVGESPALIKPMEQRDIRTVALLADVQDPAYASLDLDREELNLRQALEGFGGIDARILRPGTSNQLQEMLGSDAQVFHFSGHGDMQQQMGEEPGTLEGMGQLILSGDDRRPDPVDVATLGIQLRGKGIRLVVLNACEAAKRDPVTPWAGIASALVRQGIPAVVGMQFTVRDSSAIAFSRRFYQTLAAGESIDSAVSEGRSAILTRSGGEDRDWGVPVLYMRSSPSVLFPPPVIPVRRNLGLATATILVLSSWFYLHLYPFVADGANRMMGQLGLGAGALAGLFAIWKMIGTYAARTVRSDNGSIIEKWLRHRRAKGALVSLFVASLLVFSSTSSIYMRDDSGTGETIRVAVRTADGLDFSPRHELIISAEKSGLGGGPVFLFPPPSELWLRIEEPAGWTLKEDGPLRPRPWRSENLLTSKDFVMKKEPDPGVLRLAPTSTLMQFLPQKDSQGPHELHVTISGTTYVVPKFHKGVVWVGGSVTRLKEFVAGEMPGDRIASLKDCLISGGSEDKMMALWTGHDIFLDTPVIEPGDTISIEVISPILPSKRSVPAGTILDGRIQTECL